VPSRTHAAYINSRRALTKVLRKPKPSSEGLQDFPCECELAYTSWTILKILYTGRYSELASARHLEDVGDGISACDHSIMEVVMLRPVSSGYFLAVLAVLSIASMPTFTQAAGDLGVSAVPDTFSPASRPGNGKERKPQDDGPALVPIPSTGPSPFSQPKPAAPSQSTLPRPTPTPPQMASGTSGYAAVAVNGHGAWGASLGLATANAAGFDAVRRCGGNCRVVMTGAGRCVAFADSSSGGYWYGHAYGNDSEAVRRIALQGCSSGAPRGTCSVQHVNCK